MPTREPDANAGEPEGRSLDEHKIEARRLADTALNRAGCRGGSIRSIGRQLGVNHETLRKWVRQAEQDEGRRPGPTTEERDELTRLRAENAELRRANEILKG